MDTIPEQRSQILEAILLHEKTTKKCSFTLNELRGISRLPKRTNERIVVDLYSVKVLDCSFGSGSSPSAFWLSDRTRKNMNSFTLSPVEPACVPENRNDPILTNSNVDYRGHKSIETECVNGEGEENAA